MNVMELWTEFSESKTDKNEVEDFDSADIKRVNHLFHCLTIYSSILFWIVTPGVQISLIAALLANIDWLFGYSMVYTLLLIKEFYQVHRIMRIHTRITDPSGWTK